MAADQAAISERCFSLLLAIIVFVIMIMMLMFMIMMNIIMAQEAGGRVGSRVDLPD